MQKKINSLPHRISKIILNFPTRIKHYKKDLLMEASFLTESKYFLLDDKTRGKETS